MDLLNSILNSMDKPPGVNEHEKKLIKRQKELVERLKNKQKEELMRFRKYVEDRLERFSKDERRYIEFQPLDKVHRAVIHELSEFSGFIAMSFGREDIDRHTVVYKKDSPPSEDEVAARRNGDGWNGEIAEEYAERRRQQRVLENEQRLARATNEPKQPEQHQQQPKAPTAASSTTETEPKPKPSSNYKDKYAHLIGQDAALDAARKTETNKSYGFVPSKNKKDMRSIEQTLADIQAKKRMRLQQQQQEQEQEQEQLVEQQVLATEITQELLMAPQH